MGIDPLEKARINGLSAGVRIIDDLVHNGDLDECINRIRLAATNDSKFNWHLIEAIASLAATGFQSDQKPTD